MASLRLRLLNGVLRGLVRPRLARMTDPLVARREIALMARLFLRLPQGVRAGRCPATGLPVVWPRAAGTGVLLWLHCGGYIAGSSRTHRALAGHLACATGLPVYLPDYRLALEHPMPAALLDARAAWQALVRAGHQPAQIALGGDSAGGGLALALLAGLLARGIRPAGVVLMSPWTDLTGQAASLVRNAAADPLLPAARFADLVTFALADHPRADPQVSPLFADYAGAPPVLVQHAETEILADDSTRLAARLCDQGVSFTLGVWPDAPHAWPVLAPRLPESQAAIAQAAGFLRDCLSPR